MRNCNNCKNSYYALDGNDINLYCGYDTFLDKKAGEYCCENYKCILEDKLERNYVLYDEKFLGPGFFIVVKQGNKISKFLKLYVNGNNKFPDYNLIAFDVKNKGENNNAVKTINFNFKNVLDTYYIDNETRLYNALLHLSSLLGENKIYTTDKVFQGNDNFYLTNQNGIITLSLSKDMKNDKLKIDFISINIKNNHTCNFYREISLFYNELLNMKLRNATDEEVRKLLTLRLK